MKRGAALLGAVLAGLGVGIGLAHFSGNDNLASQLEDAALMGVLEQVVTLSFLGDGKLDELASFSHVSANRYLHLLQEYDGNISDEAWQQSKIRALSALYLLHAPDEAAPKVDSGGDVEEWQRIVQSRARANTELLKWAHSQCVEHPEYDCKSTRRDPDGS